MLSSSSRLLRVLSLLQTRSHWAGQDLAERLEVHPRTVRRDIDRLRQLGYPIHASSGSTTKRRWPWPLPCRSPRRAP
jgi:predicted DNA-binding transcriptional regulator YafY